MNASSLRLVVVSALLALASVVLVSSPAHPQWPAAEATAYRIETEPRGGCPRKHCGFALTIITKRSGRRTVLEVRSDIKRIDRLLLGPRGVVVVGVAGAEGDESNILTLVDAAAGRLIEEQEVLGTRLWASPNGQRIAYVNVEPRGCGEGNPEGDYVMGGISVVDLDQVAHGRFVVFPPRATAADVEWACVPDPADVHGNASPLAWSPDSSAIAFLDGSGPDERPLYAMTVVDFSKGLARPTIRAAPVDPKPYIEEGILRALGPDYRWLMGLKTLEWRGRTLVGEVTGFDVKEREVTFDVP